MSIQSPHWGYVVSGRIRFRYADREEVYEAGDAYYAPPGHVPVIDAGTDLVEFSPTGPLEETMAVVAKNLEALQTA
jgi:quercetin dioxygenase-like cupin family protein